MLTLVGFGRPSETISVTPCKLSGIWEKNMKLDIAINYVCSWLFFDVSTLKQALK